MLLAAQSVISEEYPTQQQHHHHHSNSSSSSKELREYHCYDRLAQSESKQGIIFILATLISWLVYTLIDLRGKRMHRRKQRQQ